MFLFRKSLSKFIVFFYLLFLFSDCIDPVPPKFNFREGLIYVDAFVSTAPGTSYVSIFEFSTEFRLFRNIFLEGAVVTLRNTETNVLVNLIEQEKTYVPPSNFVALIGESWELNITLTDGRQYQSLSEKMIKPVPISNITASYDLELFYSASEENFTPGHVVFISFDEPLDEKNYYYYNFRSYEPKRFCAICYGGSYGNGRCHADPSVSSYLTYNCDTKCFQIRYNETIELFSDDFVNGLTVNNLPVAKVPLDTKTNILVEVQQFSISPSAFKFYNILKGLVDNKGGFNAPPPAALIGNVYSVNDSEEYVLGRFTVAASSIKSVFIDRSAILETPLEFPIKGKFASPGITSVPCKETRYSTGFVPDGWVD